MTDQEIDPDHLLQDDPAQGVRRLMLNRPDRLNALSRVLADQLVAALDRAHDDPAVRVVIIGGTGRAFCAGADLSENFDGNEAPDIGRSRLWDTIENLRVPVIAAVQGWAITGGFLLAYCCDIVVAANDAKFRDTHARLGIVPTGGESQRMPRRLGPFLAKELMLTSRVLTAGEAKDAGLVSRVVEPAELGDVALGLAIEIASLSTRSTSTIKRLINQGLETDLGTGMRLEAVTNNFGRANLFADSEGASLATFRRESEGSAPASQ